MKTVTVNTAPGVDLDYESKLQLFLDDHEILKKTSIQNTPSYNVDATYRSGRISKNSKIRIEIRAHDSKYGTVMEHEVSVESLLKDPIYHGKSSGPLTVKSVDMEVFWQGEN